mgnify:CR=1 FL=1
MKDISLEQCRNVIVNHQLRTFDHDDPVKNVYAVIDHLGYVQIDTISAIERAHHRTLWTRFSDYDKKYIDILQDEQKLIFEYWGHALSYLPMKDFRFYRSAKRDFSRGWEKDWMEQNKAVMDFVINRIRDEGPLSSKDFDKDGSQVERGWGERKPAKVALELLFWSGEMMVKKRNKFVRLYDLTERVLPAGIDRKIPSEEEATRFQITRALQSMGIATANDIKDYICVASKKNINDSLVDMLNEGIIEQIGVHSQKNIEYFALVDKSTTT